MFQECSLPFLLSRRTGCAEVLNQHNLWGRGLEQNWKVQDVPEKFKQQLVWLEVKSEVEKPYPHFPWLVFSLYLGCGNKIIVNCVSLKKRNCGTISASFLTTLKPRHIVFVIYFCSFSPIKLFFKKGGTLILFLFQEKGNNASNS